MRVVVVNPIALQTPPRRRRGFTLIESAIVTVIVGVGVVAMVQLLGAGSVSNAEGAEVTVALNLANNVREIACGLEARDPQDAATWSTKETNALGQKDVKQYDDILDLDDETFSPPLDVSRSPITSMSDWSQSVKVESVAQDNLSSTRPDTVTEPSARVTVMIRHNDQLVYETSWIVSVTE